MKLLQASLVVCLWGLQSSTTWAAHRPVPLLSVASPHRRRPASWNQIARGGASPSSDGSNNFGIPNKTTSSSKSSLTVIQKAPTGGGQGETTNSAKVEQGFLEITIQRGQPTAPQSNALTPIMAKALQNLFASLKGAKADVLLLLAVTAMVPTVCASIQTSPILGFLVSGLVLGPQGLNWVSDTHTTEMLADLGVVLFLFEMGVHLSLKTLWEMKSIVFGLGGLQMLLTGGLVAYVARACRLSTAAQIVLGAGLALSSSAFVLQLLKDSNALESTKGKHAFGILLLQDLAVVPLLVATPLLAGDGKVSTSTAILTAVVQCVMAVSAIGAFGTTVMPSLFEKVLEVTSQEATIAVSLVTILGMSFLTEGLGLSNTLGAFLAGILLSETPFHHTIEEAVSPFRGILVGLFFFSVGFEIDLPLIFSKEIKTIAPIVLGLMVAKTFITTWLCNVFGLDLATSQSIGLLLSQGGEFGFVAFRLARRYKIFDNHLTKIMLTSVSLTMALTPMADGLSGVLSSLLSKQA
jgi:monovalent cation:proton antiporter-2 (CPA2) family protein